MPLVSVVIPTYNYARYLPQSIESALGQTHRGVEVIVVDDGSVDGTRDVVGRYGDRVIYRYQENIGLPRSRNQGARIARGEYFAFLDADDVWLPDKLEKQLPLLEKNPEVGMVCGMMDRIDIDGKPIPGLKPHLPPGETLAEMLQVGTALPSTFLVRRSVFDRIGGFSESLSYMEDLYFGFQVAMLSKVIVMPDILAHYRVHGDSLSHQKEKMISGYVQVFEKLLVDVTVPSLRRMVLHNLARYRYRLGKLRVSEGEFGEARRLVAGAVSAAPMFGWNLETPVGPLRRIARAAKPYAVLMGLLVSPSLLRSRVKTEW